MKRLDEDNSPCAMCRYNIFPHFPSICQECGADVNWVNFKERIKEEINKKQKQTICVMSGKPCVERFVCGKYGTKVSCCLCVYEDIIEDVKP